MRNQLQGRRQSPLRYRGVGDLTAADAIRNGSRPPRDWVGTVPQICCWSMKAATTGSTRRFIVSEITLVSRSITGRTLARKSRPTSAQCPCPGVADPRPDRVPGQIDALRSASGFRSLACRHRWRSPYGASRGPLPRVTGGACARALSCARSASSTLRISRLDTHLLLFEKDSLSHDSRQSPERQLGHRPISVHFLAPQQI